MSKAQSRITAEGVSLRAILHGHPEVRSEIEKAYRRGYAQGVNAAVVGLKEGRALPALEKLSRRVSDWRFNQGFDRPGLKTGAWKTPPELAPLAKGGK